jgi:hypothetical protein
MDYQQTGIRNSMINQLITNKLREVGVGPVGGPGASVGIHVHLVILNMVCLCSTIHIINLDFISAAVNHQDKIDYFTVPKAVQIYEELQV